MEEKKVTKISLSTIFLILAIIAIIVMGIFIYKLNNDKTAEIQKSTELQSQVNSLNDTVSDLQEKITSISETINSNNSKDMLSRKVFYSGVKDFGGIVFDILTSSFPQKMKDHAEEMLNDLLEKVSKLEQT